MFPFTTVILIVLLLLLSFYALHKVRNMHLLLHAMQDASQAGAVQQFRQIEALHGLYVELGLRHSLPATRGWAASPDFLAELAGHALAEKPRTVVECSSGVSTVVLARCMQMNGGGKVYSLEHDAGYARQTRFQLERHGLSAFAEVLVAPLRPQKLGDQAWIWYAHEVLPPALRIDLLAIDGPPRSTGAMARYPAGPLLFPRLAAGAAVFLDDANRPDERAALLRWRSEFPALEQQRRHCEKGCAVLRGAGPDG